MLAQRTTIIHQTWVCTRKVFGRQVMFDGGHVYPIHFSHEMEDEMQMLFEGSPIGRIYWLVKSIDLGEKTQAKLIIIKT
jgi:hypothetical protein